MYKWSSRVDEKNNLCGIITDGDIRRGFEKNKNLYNKTAEFLISSKKPNWVASNTLAIDALRLMEKFSITSLLVYEKDFDNSNPKILNNKNKKIIKINCKKYLVNFIYFGF